MTKRALAIVVVAFCGLCLPAWADQSAAEQKVAAIKQSLQTSTAALRGYEWMETVTVKVDGESKEVEILIENHGYHKP